MVGDPFWCLLKHMQTVVENNSAELNRSQNHNVLLKCAFCSTTLTQPLEALLALRLYFIYSRLGHCSVAAALHTWSIKHREVAAQ